MELTKLIRAADFAARAHRNQRRKNTEKTPYINHPIEVAKILTDSGVTDVDVLAAALLHDTIEDTGTTFEELKARFGEKIATIVLECSDDKSLDKVTRKESQIAHASSASPEAKLVKLADKCSNLHGLYLDPPASWSSSVIYGYVVWSYFVVMGMRGVNSVLEAALDELFKKWYLQKRSLEQLKGALTAYYEEIRNDE